MSQATALAALPERPLSFRLALPRLIAASVLVALLGVATLFGLLSWRDRAQTIRDAELQLANLSAALAQHAEQLFATNDRLIGQVGELIGPPGRPLPTDRASHEALKRLVQLVPHVSSIWVGDARGQAVLTSRQHPTPVINAADRPYFRTVRDRADAFYIGLLFDNRYTKDVFISTSRRLPPSDGPFRGFVQLSVSREYLRAFYAKLKIAYPSTFWLLDQELRPLLREPAMTVEELEAAQTQSGFAPARSREQGTFRVQGPAEEAALAGFHRLPGYGAHVVVTLKVADVLANWRQRLLAYAGSGLAAMLAILALGGLAWRQARRVEALAHSLDGRVRERTAELEATMRRLEEALAHKNVLLSEVNHRVKNSLQLVSGLLGLQARRAAEPGLAAALGAARLRVTTIARLHERLYRTDRVETVAFGAYLRDLCRQLESTLAEDGSRQLSVRCEDADLPTDIVVPLALIVNELVTNAWKHAYPAGAGGPVRVAFAVAEAGLRLEVSDDGVGLPREPAAAGGAGIGMRLVDTLVRQLGGTLRTERREPGTAFVVEAPLGRS